MRRIAGIEKGADPQQSDGSEIDILIKRQSLAESPGAV